VLAKSPRDEVIDFVVNSGAMSACAAKRTYRAKWTMPAFVAKRTSDKYCTMLSSGEKEPPLVFELIRSIAFARRSNGVTHAPAHGILTGVADGALGDA
jgi:hypothetical protein